MMKALIQLLPFFVLFGNMFVSLGLVFLYGLKWFQETWPEKKPETKPPPANEIKLVASGDRAA